MNITKFQTDILLGHTDTVILKLLITNDCYGYEIAKMVSKISDNQYELKEATMYSSLRRLEQNGDIRSYWGNESQGGRRKYYQITESGRETLKTNIENWNLTKKVLDTLLKEKNE